MPKRKRKSAGEMTTEEAGEWLFGKRGKRKVERELESPQPTEKARKSRKKAVIKKKSS